MAEGRFMVGVGAILQNTNTGKILLIQRSPKAGYAEGEWEFLSGRMKQFEKIEDALKREIEEEVGIQRVDIIKPFTTWQFFRGEKTAENEVIGIAFWVKTDTEEVTLSHEHTDFKWLDPTEAIDFVTHPGIKQDLKKFLTIYDK